MKKGFKDFSAQSFLKQENEDLFELFLEYEMDLTQKTKEEILNVFFARLKVMKRAIEKSLSTEQNTMGKMGGNIAKRLKKFFAENKKNATGEMAQKAAVYAIATNEENACMGCIVACPTAGGSGVLPGVLFAGQEFFGFSEKELIKGFLVASGVGSLIAHRSSVSGAQGGCQAEVGSAVAMAAAGLTYMRGGNKKQCFDAASLGLKNTLGLACDPIGGLVEVPCIKRNGFGTQFSLLASDMALAGITSFVPFDEVVIAMKEIGDLMPSELKETAQGGLAITPTALEASRELGLL
jgi:L-serine dehydratase